MKRPIRELLIAMLLAALCAIPATAAQNPIEIRDQDVTIAFPDQITFHAQIESSAEIERVTLEYGVEKLTCLIADRLAATGTVAAGSTASRSGAR